MQTKKGWNRVSVHKTGCVSWISDAELSWKNKGWKKNMTERYSILEIYAIIKKIGVIFLRGKGYE